MIVLWQKYINFVFALQVTQILQVDSGSKQK